MEDARLRQTLEALKPKAPNFAGHYYITEVGCGTNCIYLAFIDLKTGSVSFPFEPTISLG